MIDRKEFDLADAVILLDLYIKGQHEGTALCEIAQQASELYRSLAVAQGITVSPSFRSIAGVYGRLKSLLVTYEHIEIKGKCPTKVFKEAVALLNMHPDEFETIKARTLSPLRELTHPEQHSLVKSEESVNMQSDRQKQFYTWMSDKVSRKTLANLCACVATLDSYCIKANLFKTSVFEIVDPTTIRNIRHSLEGDQVFRSDYNQQWKFVAALLQQYERFLQRSTSNGTQSAENPGITIPPVPVFERSTNTTASQDTNKNRVVCDSSLDFQNYLVTRGKRVEEASRIISAANALSSILEDEYQYDTLFAISNTTELTSIYVRLLSNHRFTDLDRKLGGMCSKAILTYQSFVLKVQEENSIPSTTVLKDEEKLNELNAPMQDPGQFEDDTGILKLLKTNGLTYVDKRPQGGVLWLIGGKELSAFILLASKRGFRFKYCADGGRSTGNNTAWYLVENDRDRDPKAKEDQAPSPKPQTYSSFESESDHVGSEGMPLREEGHQGSFDDTENNDDPQNRLLSPLREERQHAIVISDLSQDNNLVYCSFDFIELDGMRYSASATWRGAYIWAMNVLLRYHSKQFREFLEKERSSKDYNRATCKLENGTIINIDDNATELMKRLKSAVTICNIPPKDVLIGYRSIDDSKGRISTPPPTQETVRVSLATATSFAYCKPVSCSIKGITLNHAMFWQRVYLWILNQLALRKPDDFGKAMRRVFGSQGLIRTPGYLNDGTVVELNRTATDLMRKAAEVAKASNVDPDGIIVEYIPPQDTTEVDAKGGPILAPDRQISIGDTQGLLLTPLEAVATPPNRGIEAKESLLATQLPYAYEQWLVNRKGLSKTVGNIYLKTLLLADRMLCQDDSSFSLLTETPEKIRTSFAMLKLGGGLSAARVSQFRMAIEYYAQFREARPSASSGVDAPFSTSGIDPERAIIEYLPTQERNTQSLVKKIETESTPTARFVTTEAIKQVDSPMEPALANLLQGEQLSPLRDAMIEKGIHTMEAFRALNLWVFMNQNGLYSIGQRQKIYSMVCHTLETVDLCRTNTQWRIDTQEREYAGSTPCEALLGFCRATASKYPLRFRNLIGMRMLSTMTIPLMRTRFHDDDLEMSNPTAYIESKLDAETVMAYARWIAMMCRSSDAPQSIIAPSEKSGNVTDSESIKGELKEGFEGHGEEVETIHKGEGKPAEAPSLCVSPIVSAAVSPLQMQVEKLALSADLEGITLDALYNQLQPVTMVALKQIRDTSPNLVDMGDRLIHVDAIIDLEEAAEKLKEILEKLLIKNNGYVSNAQLWEYAQVEMQMFLNDNDISSMWGIYYIARHLFEKTKWNDTHYVFSSSGHISRAGEEALSSNLDVIRKYARENNGFFRYDNLVEYLESVGIKTGNLRGQMRIGGQPIFFFYNYEEIISAESMGIDEAWLNQMAQALKRLFDDVGDHIVLRAINPIWFEQLPTLPGYRPWTQLLLQYILMFYGKRLGAKTIKSELNQNYYQLHAMLVAQDSAVQTFADAVVAYLVDNEIEQRQFEAEELRSVLLKGGLITGNELIWHVPKAIGSDPRFAWDMSGQNVKVQV